MGLNPTTLTEYVLGFKTGLLESDFYSRRTDRRTDKATQYSISIQTRETAAFGGISLTLQGSGSFGKEGKKKFGTPAAKNLAKKNWGSGSDKKK